MSEESDKSLPPDKVDLNSDVVKKGARLRIRASIFKENRSLSVAALSIGVALVACRVSVADVAPPDAFSGAEVSSVTRFLGELHPLSVHFPLALLFAAFSFEALFIKTANQKWRTSATHTLTLAAVISLATISLGLMAGQIGPFLGPDAELLWTHRLMGLLTSGLSLISVYSLAQSNLAKKNTQRAKTFELVYRITLTLATVSVFVAGHFGAKLSGL